MWKLSGLWRFVVGANNCEENMAEVKTVLIVPFNESNYGTWKIQCRMALTKDGLWGIVSRTEAALHMLVTTNTEICCSSGQSTSDYCAFGGSFSVVLAW